MIEEANGAAIRVIRERSGISQRDLAARAGISPSMLSRIESGATNASAPVLDKLAKGMRCPREAIVAYTAPASAEAAQVTA